MNDTVIAVLSTGESYQRTGLSDEEFNSLMKAKTDEDIVAIMDPKYKEVVKEKKETEDIIANTNNSSILTFNSDAVYWEGVSPLSMPKELVEAVLKAEKDKDELKVETYRNFWTLMSLNTDEECRNRLYSFLVRHGMVIGRSGFFVAYRNVVPTDKKDKDGNKIYTDDHSHSTEIVIGNMVSIPREECDSNSKVTCSKGLHAANKDWLTKNYCGSIGMVILINPCDVVAVPEDETNNYGKLRCCSYLPIDFCKYDDRGRVIPADLEDGFECEYIPKVIYEGLMGTEEDSNYKFIIPEIEGINKQSIADKLLDIARECITYRKG